METLYHYCSSESFHKIIQSKSIRLSSLLLSNDSREGNEVIKLFKVFFTSNEYNESDTEKIFVMLEFLRRYFHGIGFCLSEKGDLLSQWRGYADDGMGFSIGFRTDAIESLSKNKMTKGGRTFSLRKAHYQEFNHLTKIEPVVDEINKICSDPKYKLAISGLLSVAPQSTIENIKKQKTQEKDDDLLAALLRLSDDLYTLKNCAFSEEVEWRILSCIEGKDYKEIVFHCKRNKLIPFDLIEFDEQSMPPIEKIYIGPKNQTPIYVVKDWLESLGYGDINVSKSLAPYV